MTLWEQFLWVICPYLSLTIFTVGHLYRFHHAEFGWTSKSSEFLEKPLLKWGSILFHCGILLVFFGHIVGLLIPLSFYHAIGLPDSVYHTFAVWGGGLAGVMAVAGLFLLTYRRFSIKRMWVTSSVSDIVTIILLVVVVLFGVSATIWNGVIHSSVGFDYRTTISPWIRGVLMLRPDSTLIVDVPLPFKMHILAVFVLFAVWPFTRLVHVFSLPLTYLFRSYVIYRKRNPYQKRT